MSLASITTMGFVIIIFLIVFAFLIPFILPRIVAIKKQWVDLQKKVEPTPIKSEGGLQNERNTRRTQNRNRNN